MAKGLRRRGGSRAAVGIFGGPAANELVPDMPPALEHLWVEVPYRHRVDTVRRAIHALDARRVLVFMNYQQRLKVGAPPPLVKSQRNLPAPLSPWEILGRETTPVKQLCNVGN